MLDKLIKFILKNHIVKYEEEIKRLSEKSNNLIDELGNPKHVINKLLKEDLSWYDYEDLSPENRGNYVATGKSVLSNSTFQNEYKRAVIDIINEIAKESKSFEEVMALRMTINGMQLMKERLEELNEVDEPKKTKEKLIEPI